MSRSRLFALAALAPAAMAAIANAQFASIRTNAGGADAELREFQAFMGTGTLASQVVGSPQGASTELATRALNSVTIDTSQTPPVISNPFPAGDRSSMGMVKFDISSLPLSSDTAFWTPESKVQFRIYVRNANNVNNLFGPNPSNTAEEVNLRFRYRALNPAAVYGDDNAAAFNRTDRTGNAYVATQNKYNWDENAVTFYNAPGITPHRVVTTVTPPPTGTGIAADTIETLGLYDDYNSDVQGLGTLELRNFLVSGNALAQGSAVIFDDDSLKALVFAAQAANRQHITLFYNLDNDTNSHQPTVGINGVTPAGMLNRNYLFVPKELATVGTASNAFGDFSPELRVVPEPASIGLLMGAAAMLVRRKRA